jgi:hypothetical protein
MDAPDPGVDLHDHPWWFVSIILWGGYEEERALTREAPMMAEIADTVGHPETCHRGVLEERRPGSIKVMRGTECHTIVRLLRKRSWSLVVKGPRRGSWGFYLHGGYMPERQYDETIRGERRDLWAEGNDG